MEFLDRFPGPTRERLLAAGRVVRLKPSQHLIRRGERGGDIYLIEEGSFDVVDTRQSPEVVLNLIGPGTVVGEIAFLDAAPRTADVRASAESSVRVWERESLGRVLEAEPDFAVVFYRAIAETTVDRFRKLSSTASAGGMGGRRSLEVGASVAEQAREVAGRAQSRWLEADARLRRATNDGEAKVEAVSAFHALVEESTRWLSGFPAGEEATKAGLALARELRTSLGRARTSALSLDPPHQHSGDPRLMAHIQEGEARGEDELGAAMDQAILALPTCQGLRRRSNIASSTVASLLPPHRPARILMLTASAEAILRRLMPSLGRSGAHIRVLDSDRGALTALDAALPRHTASVTLSLQQEDIAALAVGQGGSWRDPADFIVVDSLSEYLPDRLLATLLGWLKGQLAPGGLLIITALAPARDGPIFDHLLNWPMVRRSGRDLRALVEALGFRGAVVCGREEDADPAVVVAARVTHKA